MATFDEFYSSLDSDPRIRGKQFEKFIKWFLKNDPVWESQVKNIWLWDEHPKRSEWGPDCGIDLVFEDFQNKTWAVQAKCFAPESSIKKEDMDSFISESSDSRFQGRLLVASTDRIGNNADRLLHRHKVIRYLLNDFRNSQIIFPNHIKDLSNGKRKKIKDPRKHQKKAINAVIQGLKTANRGQVLMACGTGKTLTSLWIKEALKAKNVLVLLPSLSLLSQTLKEWNANASEPFKWICVCSDKSVAKKNKTNDEWITNTSEIGVPVTSEIKEINNFLKERGSKVIFSTYQSSHLIEKVHLDEKAHKFDLIFADEAHRCTGIVSDAYGCVLDEVRIRGDKRLFLTATPRVLSNQIKSKANINDIEIASMDDTNIFGEILYQLKFSEAIKKEILSDYQVVVIGVDNEMIKEKIINRDFVSTDGEDLLDAETLASKIALTKAIKDFGLKRVITFHSRVESSERFAQDLEKIIQLIPKKDLPAGVIQSDYVSGAMKTKERNDKIEKLKNLDKGEIRILTNAKCLSEGVDVPTLDGVGFIDPRYSQIDIIQAVGRAIRKSDDKSSGTILIPVFIGNSFNTEDEILKSRFKSVWQVILALKSQDDTLMEYIDQLRVNLGKRKFKAEEREGLGKIKLDFPARIKPEFVNSIQTLLVRNTSEDWMENYGKLLDFKEKHGHTKVPSKEPILGTWVNRMRTRKHKLSQEKIKKLNDMGFIWDILSYEWNEKITLLKKFKEKHGHTKVPQKEPIFGLWVSTLRRRKNDLPSERIQELDDIGFIWDILSYEWNEKITLLKKFKEKHGHTKVPVQTPIIGRWIIDMRQRKNDLPSERIQELDDIGFIWDILSYEWNEKITLLKKFKEKHGHTKVPQKEPILGLWVTNLRSNKNNFSSEKIQELNDIGFIWDIASHEWKERISLLKQFKERHGHTKVPQKEPILGQWVSNIRQKKNSLPLEKIQELDNFGFIWDVPSYEWNQNIILHKEFKEKHGHTKVPRKEPILGQWVQNIRQKRNSLPSEKIQELDDIGFSWDNHHADSWKKNIILLKEFKEKHGHTKVRHKEPVIGEWVARLRSKKIDLSPEMIQELNDIGFIWDILSYEWNEKITLLKKFKEKHGHTKVPQKEPILGTWTNSIRTRKHKLSHEKIQELNDIGFSWDNHHADSWKKNIILLKEFKEKHGHTKVPQKEPILGTWANRMRTRKHKLSQEKIQELNDIGFSWDNHHADSWKKNIILLKEFKEKHGHTKVPSKESILGPWVSNIRQKRNSLPLEKIQELDDIGFIWDILSYEWNEKITLLKKFKEKHGHTKVPRKEPILGQWVSKIRQRKNDLPSERIQELNDIGFIWVTSNKKNL
ncbi:DEAD/DEAH box helicase [Prochlorococcus marinus]|uniref:Helicase n=1 Tax=Prochlorococcus marinus (strain AS9601) TaxID=146891 RepID=A2BNH9_PROMS|nr:DEAD/DEAH box helicase [Prochlorococcus marinus]ABM69340.1 Hypothetical protein A9601_00521 [Prochlorococcus marinus str. AS9601]